MIHDSYEDASTENPYASPLAQPSDTRSSQILAALVKTIVRIGACISLGTIASAIPYAIGYLVMTPNQFSGPGGLLLLMWCLPSGALTGIVSVIAGALCDWRTGLTMALIVPTVTCAAGILSYAPLVGAPTFVPIYLLSLIGNIALILLVKPARDTSR